MNMHFEIIPQSKSLAERINKYGISNSLIYKNLNSVLYVFGNFL